MPACMQLLRDIAATTCRSTIKLNTKCICWYHNPNKSPMRLMFLAQSNIVAITWSTSWMIMYLRQFGAWSTSCIIMYLLKFGAWSTSCMNMYLRPFGAWSTSFIIRYLLQFNASSTSCMIMYLLQYGNMYILSRKCRQGSMTLRYQAHTMSPASPSVLRHQAHTKGHACGTWFPLMTLNLRLAFLNVVKDEQVVSNLTCNFTRIHIDRNITCRTIISMKEISHIW